MALLAYFIYEMLVLVCRISNAGFHKPALVLLESETTDCRYQSVSLGAAGRQAV